MRLGIFYGGGAKFKDLIIKEHPVGWGAGFFTNVEGFGDAMPLAKRLSDRGGVPFMKLNLSWKDKHDYTERDFPSILREAKRWKPFIMANPGITFYINGAVEHNLDKVKAQKLIDQIADVYLLVENVLFINNPSRAFKGQFLTARGKLINEVHGKEPRPQGRYSYDFDGTNSTDVFVDKYKEIHKDAEFFFLFFCQNNGRKTTDDKTPRKLRNAYPDYKQLDSLIYLGTNSKGGTKFPKDWVGKSHADQHKVPREPRASKPVWITPLKEKYDKIELVAENGQVVATFGQRQPFNDKRTGKQTGWRYYCLNGFGYEVSEKAKRVQNGNPILKIRADGKFKGTANAAFRDGTER